jgi:outer membrane protein
MKLMCTMVLIAAACPPVSGQARSPMELSLKQAVEIATSPEGNTLIQLSGEALKQAESRSLQTRAALLPDVSAAFRAQSMTTNLSSMGIRIGLPIPGFQFPRFVGPFTNMDARLSATQSIFDLSAIRRFQAARTGVDAARDDVGNNAERVAALVARAYLSALKAAADVAAAEANITLSEAVLNLAQSQKNAGTGTGIEITRAKVQLTNDRQKLLVFENARRSAHLQLLRAMGLDLSIAIKLTDNLSLVAPEETTVERACALALATRSDYLAQQQREATARLSASATKLERLPSVSAFGDYGSSGAGFDNALPTRSYGISLRVPIFDGGRRDARRFESASQYRSESTRTRDLKEQIELDVRLALDALRSAEDQVKVAREGLELAESELAQARRRYEAGVANSLEVTDAQTRLERARDNQIQALYNYNVARLDMAQATGTVRRSIP